MTRCRGVRDCHSHIEDLFKHFPAVVTSSTVLPYNLRDRQIRELLEAGGTCLLTTSRTSAILALEQGAVLTPPTSRLIIPSDYIPRYYLNPPNKRTRQLHSQSSARASANDRQSMMRVPL